jgi:hypothetical protein
MGIRRGGIHDSMGRLGYARLLDPTDRRIRVSCAEKLMVHAVL